MLIEVIIVVVILAILASLGIPQYTKTMERGKSDEAMANLKAIRTAQRIYRVDTLSWSNDISTLTVSNLLDSNLRGTTSGSPCVTNLTGTPSCNDANFNGYCYTAECLTDAAICTDSGAATDRLSRAYRCRGGTYQTCYYEMKVNGTVVRTGGDPCPTVPNIF